MSKPKEKRFPEGMDNPAANGESSDANTFLEIATKWALIEVGHPNTLIIEGLAPKEAARAESIKEHLLDRFFKAVLRDQFPPGSLFFEGGPDGTWSGVSSDENEPDPVYAVVAKVSGERDVLTEKRVVIPIDGEGLRQQLAFLGLVPGEAVGDPIPSAAALATLPLSDFGPETLAIIKRIMVGRDDFLRWCKGQNIEPPEFWIGDMPTPKVEVAPTPKAGGGRSKGGRPRGGYYAHLLKFVDWTIKQETKGETHLQTADLKVLREEFEIYRGQHDPKKRWDAPKSRSGLEDAIKAALKEKGISR